MTGREIEREKTHTHRPKDPHRHRHPQTPPIPPLSPPKHQKLITLHTLYLLFPLESSWCHGPCTSAERNATVRRAGANPRRSKRVQREARRKFVAQLEISHEAAEAILRSQARRTDEKFPGIMHVSHQLALLHGNENVFFCTQCGAVNAGGSMRLLKYYAGKNVYLPVFCFEGLITEFPKITYRFPSQRASFSSQVKNV